MKIEDQLIKAGLQQMPVANKPMVDIVIDGVRQQVPASVGTYMAVSNLTAMMNQVMMLIDALHMHEAERSHPRSQLRQACPVCRAMEAFRQAQAQQRDEEVARQEENEPPEKSHEADAIVSPSVQVVEEEGVPNS